MRVARPGGWCVGLCCCTTVAIAQPLSVRDLNPLLSGYELPPTLPSTLPDGSVLSAEVAISNISLDQHSAHESAQLDGELQRWQLSFAKPISDTLGMRIELPYLRVSGGHLDNFIESFHQTFGLPNGNRDLWPTNRIWIQHVSAGQTDFSLTNAQHGIGDLTLRLGKRLGIGTSSDSKFNNTLWVSLKLPTGNADQLTGSGSVDMAFSLAATQQLSARFETQQQMSMSLLGQGDRLSDQQQHTVWSGSLGVDAKVTQHWGASMQFHGHTRTFASDLRGLGSALQLSFGPHFESGAWRGEFIISEDVAVDTAPDVQFQLGISRKY